MYLYREEEDALFFLLQGRKTVVGRRRLKLSFIGQRGSSSTQPATRVDR